MYLWLSDSSVGNFQYNLSAVHFKQRGWNYPIAEEGWNLSRRWETTVSWEDAVISGVLADWLEENTADLLAGATGPTDPAIRLRQLIDYLRSRLVSV